MKILIECLKSERFDGKSFRKHVVEGTPQYCKGFEDAVRLIYPDKEVIKTILE